MSEQPWKAEDAVKRLPLAGEHDKLSFDEAVARAAQIHRLAAELGETINAYAHLGRILPVLHGGKTGRRRLNLVA